MDAATVQRVLSLIPERGAREQLGSSFAADSGCRYPERLVLLTGLLNWMSPLVPLSPEEQRALGLIGANGRPVSARDEEEEGSVDLDEAEDDAESPLELPLLSPASPEAAVAAH